MSRKALVLLAAACVFLAAGSRIALPGAPDSTKPNAGQITAEKADVGTAAGPAKTNAGEITFELKYRGLTGAKGEPRIATFWGFGGSTEAPSTFTKSLNLPKEKGMYWPLSNLQVQAGNEEWLALELDGDKSVALYMDLDGDGNLSPNEKILPSKEKSPTGEGPFYVTPDFKRKTKDAKEYPYRILVIDEIHSRGGEKVYRSPMFGPACLWESAGSIAGKPFRLLLLDGNLDGLFTQFDKDRYVLMPEAEYLKVVENNGLFNHEWLSRLIPVGKQFYEFRLETTADGAQPAKAILKKSEIPLGKIALELKGSEGVKAELSSAYLRQGNEVFFNLTDIDGKEWELPIGSYRLERGMIRYGFVKPDGWQVAFQTGSEITVAVETPCILSLGRPKLTPAVVKEQDRYRSEAKPETVFKKGDDLYCSPEVKGMAGEKYGRFYQGNKTPDPPVRILDVKGKEVVSASMPYG